MLARHRTHKPSELCEAAWCGGHARLLMPDSRRRYPATARRSSSERERLTHTTRTSHAATVSGVSRPEEKLTEQQTATSPPPRLPHSVGVASTACGESRQRCCLALLSTRAHSRGVRVSRRASVSSLSLSGLPQRARAHTRLATMGMDGEHHQASSCWRRSRAPSLAALLARCSDPRLLPAWSPTSHRVPPVSCVG